MRNTTKRLYQIADLNIGSVVKLDSKEFLVTAVKGFYKNQTVGGGFSSSDPMAIPPTDNPTVRYEITSKSGEIKLVAKSEVTLVRNYSGIKEKLDIGTAVSVARSVVELDDLKARFITERASTTTAVAPTAAPAIVGNKYTFVHEGDRYELSFSSPRDLSTKLKRIFG